MSNPSKNLLLFFCFYINIVNYGLFIKTPIIKNANFYLAPDFLSKAGGYHFLSRTTKMQ
jgi:hypothetical protein